MSPKKTITVAYILMRLFLIDLAMAIRVILKPSFSVSKEQGINKSKVVIFAIYQSSRLRPDLKIIIKKLSDMNCDVIVVNTGSLELDEVQALGDVSYLERPNWGRDFGSYQEGIKYFFQRAKVDNIDRLVILNDSVFYCDVGIENFFETALNGRDPIIAVSENHNISWHYGSYFLSFDQAVFRHPLFARFWKKYKKTNRRQATIRRGEMALSSCLRNIVETLPHSLLSAELIEKKWREKKLFQTPLRFFLTGPSSNLKEKLIMMDLMSEFISPPPGNVQMRSTKDYDGTWDSGFRFTSSTNIGEIRQKLAQAGCNIAEDELITWFLRNLLTGFRAGSQIHQGGLLAIPCGIPLIKLDVVYRGDFSQDNLESVAAQLPLHQRDVFLSLFYRQRYGGYFLKGWRRTAFLTHLM